MILFPNWSKNSHKPEHRRITSEVALFTVVAAEDLRFNRYGNYLCLKLSFSYNMFTIWMGFLFSPLFTVSSLCILFFLNYTTQESSVSFFFYFFMLTRMDVGDGPSSSVSLAALKRFPCFGVWAFTLKVPEKNGSFECYCTLLLFFVFYTECSSVCWLLFCSVLSTKTRPTQRKAVHRMYTLTSDSALTRYRKYPLFFLRKVTILTWFIKTEEEAGLLWRRLVDQRWCVHTIAPGLDDTGAALLEVTSLSLKRKQKC